MVRVTVFVIGRVQGVFFRASAQKKAQELGVVGWARNESDGSVTFVAEGERDRLKEFVAWCHEGSSVAEVQQVTERWGRATGEFKDFSIRTS